VSGAACGRTASLQRKRHLELPQLIVQTFYGRLDGCSSGLRFGRVHLLFCICRRNTGHAQELAPAQLTDTLIALDFSHQLLELSATPAIFCSCGPAAHNGLQWHDSIRA
jgi:hypothetical protein